MADQNFMDLASKTASGIAGTDYMMLVNNSEAYKALVNDVAEAILGKLTSKSFSGLETTAKNVIGALNELNSKTARIYGHDRLSNSDDLIDTVKTYAPGIHIFYTNSQTGSLPNASEYGSTMVIACVLTQGTDVLLIAKKTDKMYQARISGGTFSEWKDPNGK